MSNDELKLPFHSLNAWLENETSPVLGPVHAKAQRLINEMIRAFEELIDVSRMLLENSRKEVEKRNVKTFGRAKALNKLAKLFLERFQQLEVPEKPSYSELEAFAKKAREILGVTEIDVRNWFPRISPFFIMDRGKFVRALERVKDSLKELSDFLAKEYVKIRLLEETFKLIAEVEALESQLTAIESQIKKVCDEKAAFEKELAEMMQKIGELKSGTELSRLEEASFELENLKKEVEYSLRHLQKPLAKLYSLALHGEGSNLTPEELKKLNQYLENPFEAFATENTGHPMLKQILGKMLRLISDGKLKLKQDKERKAKQAAEEILIKDTLTSLHEKCYAAKMRKNQLSASPSLVEAKTELVNLQGRVESLKKRCEALESERSMLEKRFNETAAKVQDQKIQIERNIFDFTGKKLKLNSVKRAELAANPPTNS
ncbi:MAG: hypothetical protein RMJ15_10105 [Nitrososphaerota archaeon]|nr:hypothetical protein [Candidatus Bathyarchaeota archaeon]MDW8024067.1 hypothetical protein [Nitrososphaerota archaeon]